jgi:hypothetical protein
MKNHRIPYPYGGLTRRGRFWWTKYRDEAGIVRQQSTGETDLAAAERFVARLALIALRGVRRRLKEIANETPGTGPGERAA